MTKTLNVRQKQKYDTASNWTTNNPVLLAGELGFESDTNKFKIGDGSTAWNSLPYVSSGGSSVTIDSSLSTTSTNPVQNAVITNELATKMKYLTSVAIPTEVQTYGIGRIEWQISPTQKLVYQYGVEWVNSTVTFVVPYTTILFANSTTQHSSDAQTQRAALKTVSTTGLTFYGGANHLCRWEAWGLVTIS